MRNGSIGPRLLEIPAVRYEGGDLGAVRNGPGRPGGGGQADQNHDRVAEESGDVGGHRVPPSWNPVPEYGTSWIPGLRASLLASRLSRVFEYDSISV